MREIVGYLKHDLFLTFCNYYFFLSIVGIYLCLILGTKEFIGWNISVLYNFYMVVHDIAFLLIIPCCALAGSICFFREIHSNYWKNMLIRGNMRGYLLSKFIVTGISSFLSLFLGILTYILHAKSKLPWVQVNDPAYEDILQGGGLRYFIKEGHYILYIFLFSIQFSVLCSLLAIFSVYISLRIGNELLSITLPLLLYYSSTYLSYGISKWVEEINLYYIFNPVNNVWEDDFKSFVYAIIVGVFGVIILYVLMKKGLCRRISNE